MYRIGMCDLIPNLLQQFIYQIFVYSRMTKTPFQMSSTDIATIVGSGKHTSNSCLLEWVLHYPQPLADPLSDSTKTFHKIYTPVGGN